MTDQGERMISLGTERRQNLPLDPKKMWISQIYALYVDDWVVMFANYAIMPSIPLIPVPFLSGSKIVAYCTTNNDSTLIVHSS